jgi:hypothetical protein
MIGALDVLFLGIGWGGGAGGDVAAPQIVGQTRQSGNIHFTVGQYWLIIKINRRNSLNIGGNMLYNS